MKCLPLFILFLSVAFTGMQTSVAAQITKGIKEHRILIVLNGSAGMNSQWTDNTSRFKAASGFIARLVQEMNDHNDQIAFGLRVYGHQFNADQNNCADTRREVAFTKDNHAQVSLRLEDLFPKGSGSVTHALNEAIRSDLTDTQSYYYSILLVTDDNAKCDNDPCASLAYLGNNPTIYKRYYVEMSPGKQLKSYECFDKRFAISSRDTIAGTIRSILSDFPKGSVSEKIPVNNIAPRQRVENGTVYKQAIKDTLDTDIPDVTESKKQEVAIGKNSKITTAEVKTGYLNLMNVDGIGRFELLQLKDGSFSRREYIDPSKVNAKRIKLPEGTYRLLLPGSASFREFRIKANMITDVRVQ